MEKNSEWCLKKLQNERVGTFNKIVLKLKYCMKSPIIQLCFNVGVMVLVDNAFKSSIWEASEGISVFLKLVVKWRMKKMHPVFFRTLKLYPL